MKRDTVVWLACMIVASIALVYSLWVVAYIPTQDGPEHLFSGHVENHFSDAGSIYPDYYRMLPQFAGKGFALVYGPLESLLPWRTAARLTFSIVALAFAWGFALVVLALDRERRSTALLGFLIALPWAFYMGFFPYVVGSTLGLYSLAFVIGRPTTTNKRRVSLALLLLLQGVCHVFTAVLTGLVVAAITIARAPKGARLRELGRMTLIGLPAVALLAATFFARHFGASVQSVFEWSLDERPRLVSRWIVPGSGVGGWLVLALVVFGIATTVARARSKSAGANRPPVTELALAGLAAAYLVLALLAPIHIPGWQLFAPRFVILGCVMGLALVDLPARATPRMRRALAPVLALCAVASSVGSSRLHRTLASGCADAIAGLDAPMAFAGPRLPVLLDGWCGAPREPADSPVPGAAMAFHMSLLYLIDHGGVAARLFNGAPSIHAIAFRGSRMPRPPDGAAQEIAQSHWLRTDENLRTSVLTELAANGMPFDGVCVLGGRPSDFELFRERGYATDFERGSLFIGHFEGCPAELSLPEGSLDKEPVYYEVGLFSRFLITPEPRPFARRIVDRDSPVKDGRIRVPLAMRPCGELWLRVVWDADASSTLTPGDRTCAGERLQGRVRARVGRANATIECTPHALGSP